METLHLLIISQNQPIVDSRSSETTLFFSGKTFELGFFSPGNSKNGYIGIWYKNSPNVVVWVANRNNPLMDSYVEFTINNEESQLVLLNKSKGIVWFSNLSSQSAPKNLFAQLLEPGNLVLREYDNMSSNLYLWQSFDYPTDTLLVGMKLGWDLNTGFERDSTSSKSADDPSTGDYF